MKKRLKSKLEKRKRESEDFDTSLLKLSFAAQEFADSVNRMHQSFEEPLKQIQQAFAQVRMDRLLDQFARETEVRELFKILQQGEEGKGSVN